MLSISIWTLLLGTACTVWTGIGAVGAFAVGVLVLGEPLALGRMATAALIVAGLVLMSCRRRLNGLRRLYWKTVVVCVTVSSRSPVRLGQRARK